MSVRAFVARNPASFFSPFVAPFRCLFLPHLLIQFFIQKKRRAFTFYTSFDCIVNEGGVSSEGKYIFPLFSQGEMWQQERDQVVK